MARFRLSAGTPATRKGGGRPASPEPSPETVPKRARHWAPNMDRPLLLKCGCEIPWPIVTLFGSRSKTGKPQVACDLHGWQHVSDSQIRHAKQLANQAREVDGQETLDDEPPF